MIGLKDSGTASAADATSDTAASPVREGIFTLPGTLPLHLGGELRDVQIAWRLDGATGPVIAALGGISAGRYVTGKNPKGWWSDVVGPDGALDTTRYRILGFDFLGGSGQTTGPRSGEKGFPSISAFDQAEILRRLVSHLGIDQLHAIVGASYGAMVALAFA